MLEDEQVETVLRELRAAVKGHVANGEFAAADRLGALTDAIQASRNGKGHTVLFSPDPLESVLAEEFGHLWQVTDDLQQEVVDTLKDHPVITAVADRLNYGKIDARTEVAEVTAKALANDEALTWRPGERAKVIEVYKEALANAGVSMDRMPRMREDQEAR